MISTGSGEKGFTLVELMIVVAIIGILAAIAVPNFIAIRNKSFCSQAEADANGVASAIADYFAVPAHTSMPSRGELNAGAGYTTSRNNSNTLTITSADPNLGVTITVTDISGRCPQDYQQAQTPSWDGNNVFTKRFVR